LKRCAARREALYAVGQYEKAQTNRHDGAHKKRRMMYSAAFKQ